ncbi:S1C family serine protease [Roseiconus lacunae]|uniref:S1C family serine protease n=1 Tax=Roseiconus lacunae TaxID=2605694 RepID=UPI003F53A57E
MLRRSGIRSIAFSAVAALTMVSSDVALAQTRMSQSQSQPSAAGTYGHRNKSVSIDSQTPGANGTYQLMRPSLDRPSLPQPPEVGPAAPTASMSAPSVSIDDQRDTLFAELAEEFNAFDRLGRLVRKVSHLVKPSVIHIEAHKTETNNGKYESYDEAGSGVVVKVSGSDWILTNRHVILGASPNEILLRSADGRQFRPTRIYTDEGTDVAVMQVTNMDLPAARVGDSESVGIGDFTIAIGSPFGLSHSVTFGILSAKGRRDLSLGDKKIDLQDFFQTDAAINPGNSGGPLLNLRGEVIGLNTAIASSSGGSEGIGFAIPINMAMRVADELVRYGRYRRGYLGVVLDPDFGPNDLGSMDQIPSGALVKTVHRGSPAAKANLQRGDIIVRFNGAQVENDDHLVAQVGMTPIGSNIPMIIYRDGKRYRAEVELTDLN